METGQGPQRRDAPGPGKRCTTEASRRREKEGTGRETGRAAAPLLRFSGLYPVPTSDGPFAA